MTFIWTFICQIVRWEPSDLNLTYINAQAPQWPKQILAKGSQQQSGATLVCCTISGFFYCIHASFSSSSSSSSSWLQAASIFLESPKRHRCAAPPFLSSAKNGTHAGPTRFSQKWLGRLNKVQRSHQRENPYWWEHIAKPTSQVQVKAGDLCDPIYKASVSIHVGFAWLCLLLKPKQPRRLHIQFKCSSVDQPKALALVYCTLAGSWCLPSGTANVAAVTNTLIEITRQYGYIMLHWVLQLLSLKAHTHTQQMHAEIEFPPNLHSSAKPTPNAALRKRWKVPSFLWM